MAVAGRGIRDIQAIRPTTKAQVSGHRFLRRRVEHGLVFGDIRMIHDPLDARRRAMLFGVVATALTGLGAGLLAWLSPDADPGDAVILQDSRGQLYVQLADTVHPVSNLTSAQLIAGGPDQPAAIGDEQLGARTLGAPVGIPGAPSLVVEPGPLAWTVCTDQADGSVTVVAGQRPPDSSAALASLSGTDWLITGEGRRALPDEHSELGRVLRRRLGIEATTPRLQLAPEVLTVVPELPGWRPPEGPLELLRTGERHHLLVDAAVAPLSTLQAEILLDLGAGVTDIERPALAEYPDAPVPEPWLPAEPVALGGDSCLSPAGVHAVPESSPVPLSGAGVADRFATTAGGAVAVDTGGGHFLIGASGTRHALTPDSVAALGVTEPEHADWSVIRLLPEGPPLDRDQALSGIY